LVAVELVVILQMPHLLLQAAAAVQVMVALEEQVLLVQVKHLEAAEVVQVFLLQVNLE
jgi:hypothetical protein